MVPCLPPVSISSQTAGAWSAPWPAGRIAKQGDSRAASSSLRHGRQAAKQPVRGHDDQARVLHPHEHHQHEVGRMILPRKPDS